jgi:pimeloyl-ACP methyl ester carboxylesterase
MSVNVVAELVTCPAPILYIRGTRDRVVPERCLRLILRERPNVQIVRLEAPHLVLQVQADGAASAIRSFAASAGAV